MTIRFEIVADVFVEVEADSAMGRIALAQKACAKAEEALTSLPYEEAGEVYNEAYRLISPLMDEVYYDPSMRDYREVVNDLYWSLSAAEEHAYRNYAEADFLEYASHKGEEGFDWGFYSDWHKDLYGFRPRK